MYLIFRSTPLIALLAGLIAAAPASAQDPIIPPFNRTETPGDPPAVPAADAAGEIQGRGPIHEGFAQPSTGVGRAGPLVPKRPPEPIPETPPEQRPAGDNVAWIPGYWGWDVDRRDFLWVSGFWRVAPAGRAWVSGYWSQTDDGWRWVSGLWNLAAQSDQSDVPYLPVPPESVDRGPSVPPPEADYSYVPGTWLYDESRWLWRPGYYVPPRVGLLFTPSRYAWTPRGYRFVPGFWDRPLDSRGVLFAPVYFGSDFAPADGWSYRPSFAVDIGVALGSLWVGPGGGCYAFGDYYAPRYAHAGYQSWLSYGPSFRDPLYGYYRHAHRDDPAWRGNLVDTHNGRLRGTISAPPTTLAAQGRTRDASLHSVTPLSGYRNNSIRMTRVTPADRRVRENAASADRRTALSRQVAEVRSAPRASAPTRPRENAYTNPGQRSPYSGYTPSPNRVLTTAPSTRETPRTLNRPTETPRSNVQAPPPRYTPPHVTRSTPQPAARYTPPPAQRYTPPPAARSTPQPAARYTPPPAQRYTPPPTAHSTPPPTQRYTPPQARSTPPARSTPQPATRPGGTQQHHR